jgi:hypothetical protein
MSFYLDCDTTPPLRGRTLHAKQIDTAKRRAFSLLADVSEGQIGIYDHPHGGDFYGYAIKHAGEEPYFEQPSADGSDEIVDAKDEGATNA